MPAFLRLLAAGFATAAGERIAVSTLKAEAAATDEEIAEVVDKVKRLAELELERGGDETEAAMFLGDAGDASGEKLLREAEAVMNHANLQDALSVGEVITSADRDKLEELATGVPVHLEESTETDDGSPVVQGDMVYDTQEEVQASLLQIQNGTRWPGTPWTDGKFRYCYAADVLDDVKAAWEAALKHITSQVPCVSYEEVPLASHGKNCKSVPAVFLQSTEEMKCWSYIGMKPKGQKLNLGKGCGYMGTAAHEILHAMGFNHEQSRADRDKYIKVHWERMMEGKEVNFKIDSNSFTRGPYDPLSIMHYAADSFAKDPSRPVLEGIKNERMSTFMGQRDGLSEVDNLLLATMYGCKAKALVSTYYRSGNLILPPPAAPVTTEGKLRVWIKSASAIPLKRNGQPPSTFIMLEHGKLSMETKSSWQSQDPQYNSAFTFDYTEGEPLRFMVIQQERRGLPYFMGGEKMLPQSILGCSKGCSLPIPFKKDFFLVNLCVSICTPENCGCKREELEVTVGAVKKPLKKKAARSLNVPGPQEGEKEVAVGSVKKPLKRATRVTRIPASMQK